MVRVANTSLSTAYSNSLQHIVELQEKYDAIVQELQSACLEASRTASHLNHRQKISLHLNIKQENNALKLENLQLRQELKKWIKQLYAQSQMQTQTQTQTQTQNTTTHMQQHAKSNNTTAAVTTASTSQAVQQQQQAKASEMTFPYATVSTLEQQHIQENSVWMKDHPLAATAASTAAVDATRPAVADAHVADESAQDWQLDLEELTDIDATAPTPANATATVTAVTTSSSSSSSTCAGVKAPAASLKKKPTPQLSNQGLKVLQAHPRYTNTHHQPLTTTTKKQKIPVSTAPTHACALHSQTS